MKIIFKKNAKLIIINAKISDLVMIKFIKTELVSVAKD